MERPPRPCYGPDRSEIWTHDCLTLAPSLGSERPLWDVPVGSGGHSILHESSTQVPGTGVEDLSPKGSRNLGLSGLSNCWGWVTRKGGLACFSFPFDSTLAGALGTATSDPKLDLGIWHRRLVGVSVNCHIQIQDFLF